jgi:hypothetical protein
MIYRIDIYPVDPVLLSKIPLRLRAFAGNIIFAFIRVYSWFKILPHHRPAMPVLLTAFGGTKSREDNTVPYIL